MFYSPSINLFPKGSVTRQDKNMRHENTGIIHRYSNQLLDFALHGLYSKNGPNLDVQKLFPSHSHPMWLSQNFRLFRMWSLLGQLVWLSAPYSAAYYINIRPAYFQRQQRLKHPKYIVFGFSHISHQKHHPIRSSLVPQPQTLQLHTRAVP